MLVIVYLTDRDVYKATQGMLRPDLAAASAPSSATVSTVTPSFLQFSDKNGGRGGVAAHTAA